MSIGVFKAVAASTDSFIQGLKDMSQGFTNEAVENGAKQQIANKKTESKEVAETDQVEIYNEEITTLRKKSVNIIKRREGLDRESQEMARKGSALTIFGAGAALAGSFLGGFGGFLLGTLGVGLIVAGLVYVAASLIKGQEAEASQLEYEETTKIIKKKTEIKIKLEAEQKTEIKQEVINQKQETKKIEEAKQDKVEKSIEQGSGEALQRREQKPKTDILTTQSVFGENEETQAVVKETNSQETVAETITKTITLSNSKTITISFESTEHEQTVIENAKAYYGSLEPSDKISTLYKADRLIKALSDIILDSEGNPIAHRNVTGALLEKRKYADQKNTELLSDFMHFGVKLTGGMSINDRIQPYTVLLLGLLELREQLNKPLPQDYKQTDETRFNLSSVQEQKVELRQEQTSYSLAA